MLIKLTVRSPDPDNRPFGVGKRKTTWASARNQDLEGECTGATHFVRGATIGAFAMQNGSKGHANTVADIFGAGVSAAAGNERIVSSVDGLLDACTQASPAEAEPPQQCGALIRIELVKIDHALLSGKEPLGDDPKTAVVSTAESCPTGFVFAEGKCARSAQVSHHACQRGEVRDCSVQCEKGSADSCNTLGVMFDLGRAAIARGKFELGTEPVACFVVNESFGGNYTIDAPSLKEAIQSWRPSCEKGTERDCTLLGLTAMALGDVRAAKETMKAACVMGDRWACELRKSSKLH